MEVSLSEKVQAMTRKTKMITGGIAILLIIIIVIIAVATTGYCEDGNSPSGTPGLRRQPDQSDDFACSSLIQYNYEEELDTDTIQGYAGWVERYGQFLKKYEDQSQADVDCRTENRASNNKICKFDLSTLGNCGKGKYGYDKGNPCIILELNKIYGFEPIPYSYASEAHGMSAELVEHIRKQTDKNQVWVECYGKNENDKEALRGKIEYFPKSQGFPNYYFPYLDQNDYKSPLVAVQFKGIQKNLLIQIECRAFAKNIFFDQSNLIGINRFALHVLSHRGA